MATCFLFADHLNDETGLSLRLDDQSQIDAPLMMRDVDEIKALQVNAKTIIVLAASNSVLYELELPWLSAKKARMAIPYALEEQLTQPISSLHFAFDKQHYYDNHYLVVVTNKVYLLGVIDQLQRLNLTFDAITLDWFALNKHESCVYESQVLVNNEVFLGSLSAELLPLYHTPETTTKLAFKDSIQQSHFTPTITDDELGAVWVSKRLLIKPYINLCQGDLWRMCRKSHDLSAWYYLGAGLIILYFISVLISNLWILLDLKKQNKVLDQKITTIYHEFFPNSNNLINPKLQISQYLKQHSSQNQELWEILGALTTVVKSPTTIESIKFQASRMFVTLTCADFAALEKLEEQLKQLQLHVVQTEASASGDHVTASLELFI